MHIRYYNREKRKGNFSIEELFTHIKSGLPKEIRTTDFYFNASRSRLQNILDAKKNQGDVNHITGDINFVALGLKGKRTILTVHDLGYFENPVHHPLKKFIYKLFWLSLPLKKVSYITTVSNFTKNKIIQYFNIPSEKIKVIYNPYNQFYKYSPYQYNSAKPKILLIGTGDHKNFERLFEAVKGMSCRLCIVGFLNQKLRTKLEELNIEFENHFEITKEEVYQKYVACDLLFFASLYEGFGVPILEANSVGRPVITSSVASMPEVAGNAAVLVDPYNVEEIRNAIHRINTDQALRDELIKNGLLNIKRFELETIAAQYFSLYKMVANNN